MSKTTFTYCAEDGYVTGARPLHVSIPDSELQAAETDEEAYDIVCQVIEEDFAQKVSPSWSQNATMALVRAARAKGGAA